MVLPTRLTRFNRVVTNRITGPFVSWLPGFGVVVHTGRRSGQTYRTPVNVFREPNGYVIALTYGPEVDWVKNLVAANGCTIITRRREHVLSDPRIVRDETRAAVPLVVRQVLRLTDVSDFLHLTEQSGSASGE
jgi:deazaflavin-dependent oxidoreductase (nitroreductase family)